MMRGQDGAAQAGSGCHACHYAAPRAAAAATGPGPASVSAGNVGSMEPAAAWVVAGPPGAGKSTVAALLLGALRPVPAVLDKDTMYGPFVAATLAAAGRPPGEREGPWYDEHVKVHEYGGMTATAREIRGHGCPVLLLGPVHRPDPRRRRLAGLGRRAGRRAGATGLGPVRRGHPSHRLAARGSGRDTAKLADFTGFTASMRLGTEPAAPHATIDNRHSAPEPLAAQVAALLRRLAD